MRQHARVDPVRVDVARVDGEARRELEPAALGRRAEQVELGPGRLGVDVVDRHRRDAAPVVDPGVEQPREVLGQVRRRLQRDLRRQDQPRDGDRPEELLERRLRRASPSACPAWRGSSGRSPPARAARPPRSPRSASSRSARVSPIPIRIPVVNGTRASPASRSVSSRAAGSLSGEPKCGPPRAESRSAVVSTIIPIDAATGRRSSKSAAVEHARVQVRQQRGLLEHRPRGVREILERRARTRARRARPAPPRSEARACPRA